MEIGARWVRWAKMVSNLFHHSTKGGNSKKLGSTEANYLAGAEGWQHGYNAAVSHTLWGLMIDNNGSFGAGCNNHNNPQLRYHFHHV